MLETLIFDGVIFGRNFLGIINRPYETYRHLVKYGRWGELWYIGLILAGYFALASVVKTAEFRPFLLTKQFVLLLTAALLTAGLVISLLTALGRAFGGSGGYKEIIFGWGYTLIPTVIWFLTTSILYVLIPPPRTTSWQGLVFSFLYLLFSLTLLFWKLTLAYLTLRFGMKLDLGKIVLIGLICVPIIGLYSMLMYRAGIFKVPFI